MKFNSGATEVKKVIFTGGSASPNDDRQVRLVDFIQIMLELNWKSDKVMETLYSYNKKGKIDSKDERELFLIFAMKRKLKMMSHMINSDDFNIDMSDERHFVDVLENDIYDMAVLLYREYFLVI